MSLTAEKTETAVVRVRDNGAENRPFRLAAHF